MFLKQFSLFLIATLLVMNVSAQHISQDKLPHAISKGFKTKYADVVSVDWTKSESRAYDADFKSGETNYTATFSDDGKWIKTESDLENNELPTVIKATLAKQFDGYTIVDSELIDSADKGRLYAVHLERKDEMLLVTFNEDGKVITRENDDDEG